MLKHYLAFERIHVSCILVRCINMHSPALHLLHHNAFSIWCIYMHYYASIIRCICIHCCIIMHLVHVMHLCALPYACILNVMHTNAFGCMQMRCIRMHSDYDAFMCINPYSSPRRRTIARFGCAMRGAMIASYLLHDGFKMHTNAYKCIRIHTNASKCVRMRTHAPDSWTTHTYTREAERTQG
jgi:hypothetical protein